MLIEKMNKEHARVTVIFSIVGLLDPQRVGCEASSFIG
jgi:hypothetical protein